MIVDREFGAGDSDEVPEDSTDIDKFSLSPRESNKPDLRDLEQLWTSCSLREHGLKKLMEPKEERKCQACV